MTIDYGPFQIIRTRYNLYSVTYLVLIEDNPYTQVCIDYLMRISFDHMPSRFSSDEWTGTFSDLIEYLYTLAEEALHNGEDTRTSEGQ
jgi:hypothetical protein